MTKLSLLHAAGSEFRIVGIGASAGGISELQTLLSAVPPESGLAVVLVQHLAPGQHDRLLHFLSHWSALPARRARDGESLCPGRLYVASADEVLTVEGGVFRSQPAQAVHRGPGIDNIDAFLESLAQDCGPNAIAVVLSGMGNDGATGAASVLREGGTVIVQDPLTAMHDSMPRAVLERNAAHYVLPVGEIAPQLLRCVSPGYERPARTVDPTVAPAHDLDRIVELIRRQEGLDLSGYKASPLLWRIRKRMSERRVTVLRDYESLLRDDPGELQILLRRLPIHATGFFRDGDAWEALKHDVILPLMDSGTRTPLRAWVTACATGEEAYSLAMLLSEAVAAGNGHPGFQVFSTDASAEIVAHASRGVFSQPVLQNVSDARRSAFFYGADGTFRVKRDLRERMAFAPHDLLADPPLPDIDLVTCRNLLIYLNSDAIDRVLALLHAALRVGGYLFLGMSEVLPVRQQGFEAVSKRFGLYRKTGPTRGLNIPVTTRHEAHVGRGTANAIAHRAAIEHFDLPSVLIDHEFRILQFYGDTSDYLRQPTGRPTDNLLDLLERAFVAEFKAAAEEAIAGSRSVTLQHMPDRARGQYSSRFRVTPLRNVNGTAGTRLLVSFIPPERVPADQGNNNGMSYRGTARARELDIQNNAMRVSYAELDASREELQVLNEELNVSNEQLKEKVAELEMQSRVLSAGAVMTLFLDDRLDIQWFTPAITALLPLMPGDVGRRVTDLSARFDDPKFLDDARSVLSTREPREAELKSHDGRWYLRRARPYLTPAQTVAGVAITFTDITERRRAEQALHQSAGRNAFLVRLADALRSLSVPSDMRNTAARVLREHLDASRVIWVESDPAGAPRIVAIDSAQGARDPDGRYEIGAHAAHIPGELLSARRSCSNAAGRTIDATHGSVDREGEAGAWANLPLIYSRRVTGTLIVHLRRAHPWSSEELTFLDLVAERTWAAVERARAEEQIRTRNDELERFDAVTVGRELRMIELKEQVNALRRRLGEAPDYPLDFGPTGGSSDA
jgi:two-component system, chemotaxis family, CheB/CheR fusion protein